MIIKKENPFLKVNLKMKNLNLKNRMKISCKKRLLIRLFLNIILDRILQSKTRQMANKSLKRLNKNYMKASLRNLKVSNMKKEK